MKISHWLFFIVLSCSVVFALPSKAQSTKDRAQKAFDELDEGGRGADDDELERESRARRERERKRREQRDAVVHQNNQEHNSNESERADRELRDAVRTALDNNDPAVAPLVPIDKKPGYIDETRQLVEDVKSNDPKNVADPNTYVNAAPIQACKGVEGSVQLPKNAPTNLLRNAAEAQTRSACIKKICESGQGDILLSQLSCDGPSEVGAFRKMVCKIQDNVTVICKVKAASPVYKPTPTSSKDVNH